jgi:hypothetical protein
MDVYYVQPKDFAACSFDNLDDALEEIRMHLQDGVKEVKVVVKEITQDEYDNLPEFEGY